jgi:hypothetical protein
MLTRAATLALFVAGSFAVAFGQDPVPLPPASSPQSPHQPAGVKILPDVPASESPPEPRLEGWGLKGDLLGADLGDFKTRHRRLTEGGQYAPDCSDRNPEHLYIKIEGPALGRVNCRLTYPFEFRKSWEKGYVPPPTVAEIPTVGHLYRFLDLKLWKIEMYVAEGDFVALLAATEAKYGPPTRSSTEQVQNKLGNSFAAAVLLWEAAGQVLELRQMSGRLDVSSFVMYRQDLEAEAGRRARQAAGKAAEDM